MCTGDPIFNLGFLTADQPCVFDGSICDSAPDADSVADLQILDLHKAAIAPWTHVSSEGYSIAGDQSSWVSNGTEDMGFDFQIPTNYSDTSCIPSNPPQIHFAWNHTVSFTYTVNFTNTSAAANFSLSAPQGTIVMLFEGQRVDDDPTADGLPYAEPTDGGHEVAIALDTSNPKMPMFTFANGTKIKFNNTYDGIWTAEIDEATKTSVSPSVVGMTWTSIISAAIAAMAVASL